jgi:peptidyl-tRNA hydrolase, PTH1 family
VALVLGLGNPGKRYARTRHNVGWRVVETLIERWHAAAGDASDAYRSWRADRPSGTIDLMIPLTFMNRSGEALETWRSRHGFDSGSLIVIADDVYLPVGFLRVRAKGSSGGHRGLDSIENALGHRDFARLRLGIGASTSAAIKEHVLEEPEPEEEEALEGSILAAADAVECWAEEGVLAAMNRYNRRVPKEVSEP